MGRSVLEETSDLESLIKSDADLKLVEIGSFPLLLKKCWGLWKKRPASCGKQMDSHTIHEFRSVSAG